MIILRTMEQARFIDYSLIDSGTPIYVAYDLKKRVNKALRKDPNLDNDGAVRLIKRLPVQPKYTTKKLWRVIND